MRRWWRLWGLTSAPAKNRSAAHRAGRRRHRLCDQRDARADRRALAAGVARVIQSRSGRHRDGQCLSADCRADVRILWPGSGALFRIPGRRTTFLASVDWIPPRLRCDRWRLACPSPNRFAQLAVRRARLRPDRLRCRAYGGDHIRGVVWSRANYNCAQLATTMNVASRFCAIAVSSNGCAKSSPAYGAGVNVKLFMGKLDQRAEGNRKANLSD